MCFVCSSLCNITNNMGFQLVLFTLQVLTFQHVFSYPVRDILAYISLEDYAYLTSAKIVMIPISYYYVTYPGNSNTYNYYGQCTSGGLTYTSTYQRNPVFSTTLPLSQLNNVATITVLLSTYSPQVTILPSTPLEVPIPILSTNQFETDESTTESEFIEKSLTESPIIKSTMVDTAFLPDPSVVATAPVSGKVTFGGPLQAHGTIKIYGTGY